MMNFEYRMMNVEAFLFFILDEFLKSLILFAPQAILGFMTRLAKLQELGLTPSNSLQFWIISRLVVVNLGKISMSSPIEQL